MDKNTYAEIAQIILKNTSVPPCVIDDILAQIQTEINDILTACNPNYNYPEEVLIDYGIPLKYLPVFIPLDNPF